METSKSGLTPGTESKQRADCLGLDRAAQVVVNEDWTRRRWGWWRRYLFRRRRKEGGHFSALREHRHEFDDSMTQVGILGLPIDSGEPPHDPGIASWRWRSVPGILSGASVVGSRASGSQPDSLRPWYWGRSQASARSTRSRRMWGLRFLRPGIRRWVTNLSARAWRLPVGAWSSYRALWQWATA